jgi:GNAT superfamily N-acetyltransferase
MPTYFFDDTYEEHATLRDGSPVLLRLIQPDDKQLIRDGFERLSPESRYRRFFTPKHHLSDEELCYLTEIDQVRHVAIGALRRGEDGRDLGLGVARFVALDPEPGTAEAAIAVLDEMQGKGLGSLLFQRLVAAACERGVTRFRCEVLGSNRAMHEFLRGQAADATVHWESGVAAIEFVLPSLAPEHDYREPPRESAVYRLFSDAARGLIEWRAAISRLRWRDGDRRGDGEREVDDTPDTPD